MSVIQANRRGMLWAGVSALSYATMNVFLRYVALDDVDPFFAAFMRTLPVTFYCWFMVIRPFDLRGRSHRNLLPPRRFWLTLIGIGVIYNVTGNAAFQISLTLSGLVLTVPITHSTMLWSAAFAGLLILGESITRAVAIGVTLLIASLVFLTAGASSSLPQMEPILVAVAILTAMSAGMSYGIGTAVYRRRVANRLTTEQALSIITLTGMISTGVIAYLRVGLDGALATPPIVVLAMLAAGVANAVALTMISKALQYIAVAKANAINATQIALSALAGLLIFAEPVTALVLIGLGLTIAGLLSIGRQPARVNQANSK